jgi:hypothetical protein
MSKKISIFSGLILILICVTVGASWATKYSLTDGRYFSSTIRKKVLYVSDLPIKINSFLRFSLNILPPTGKTDPYRRLTVPAGDKPKIGGYLLIPYTDSNWVSRVIILDIAKNESHEIFSQSQKTDQAEYTDYLIGSEEYRHSGGSSKHRLTHPCLSKDGHLYYLIPWNDLVCFNTVSGKEEWRVRGAFHHSINLDHEGNIWACGAISPRMDDSLVKINKIDIHFEDQALVKISKTGKILETISVANLMLNCGLEHLLYGCSNPKFLVDPIHLNYINPVQDDGELIKKGWLLVSLRNLSTILIVDPVTKTVNWFKSGPWMNQHCVISVSETEFSVLDNHGFAFGGDNYWLVDEWKTKICVHDIKKNETKIINLEFEGGRVQIPIEGQALPIADGSWIVEDSIHGTIFLIEDGVIKLKWSNRYPDGNVGYTSWCRFLSQEEGKSAVERAGRAIAK